MADLRLQGGPFPRGRPRATATEQSPCQTSSIPRPPLGQGGYVPPPRGAPGRALCPPLPHVGPPGARPGSMWGRGQAGGVASPGRRAQVGAGRRGGGRGSPVVAEEAVAEHEPAALIALDVIGPLEEPALARRSGSRAARPGSRATPGRRCHPPRARPARPPGATAAGCWRRERGDRAARGAAAAPRRGQGAGRRRGACAGPGCRRPHLRHGAPRPRAARARAPPAPSVRAAPSLAAPRPARLRGERRPRPRAAIGRSRPERAPPATSLVAPRPPGRPLPSRGLLALAIGCAGRSSLPAANGELCGAGDVRPSRWPWRRQCRARLVSGR